MVTLRIQHAVPNFEGWKRAFDNDPVSRREGGVRRYRVYRDTDEPDLVMIDLEFDDVASAASFRERLRRLWEGPGRAVMRGPQAWILETVESVETHA